MNGADPQYWDGRENKSIRLFFYCQRGVGLINEFRNVFFIIIGAYFSLKINLPIWMGAVIMLGMFLISIPILIVAGWFSVHRMGKVIDYLNVKFSTHYAKEQFEIFKGMYSELKEINKNRRGEK